MIESSTVVKTTRRKVKAYTRRQRNAQRRRNEEVLREERLADRAERRVFQRRYAMFFGCDPERTEALSESS